MDPSLASLPSVGCPLEYPQRVALERASVTGLRTLCSLVVVALFPNRLAGCLGPNKFSAVESASSRTILLPFN